MEDLITLCTATKHYVIDTESDLDTHLPAIIQILPIPADSSTTPLVLIIIEVNHLPPKGKSRIKIEEVCNVIFKKDHHLNG
ncbi:unnamed protein product [Didymodactylos carnosus]|nr:unnamed protein product [Didymodactylos carnosus]CAF3772449.1 unnamed protein product [Didymodactylos carnosus]